MLEQGAIISGRYRLATQIGEGAMGEVWKAEDQTLKRNVAIKVLFLQGARDRNQVLEQFLREARIAASVQHRNVIQTVDFGTSEDLPFMVMELLNGESLEQRMEREPRQTIPEVLQIASLTLRGLAAVHDAGIVHRDLKPANIFLQKEHDGVFPKILDFGISRSLEGPSAIKTTEGLIVGTPDYMSPEQARGEADIDRRSDIYSMGAILYEGISGQLPFVADTIGELIVEIVTGTPAPLKKLVPGLPKILSDVIGQAMAHDREERFVDARVMRTALMGASQRALPEMSAPAVSEAPPMPMGAAPRPPAPAPPPPPPPSPPADRESQVKGPWGDMDIGDDAPPDVSAPPPPPPVAPATFADDDPFERKGKVKPKPAAGGGADDGDRLTLDVGPADRSSGAGRPERNSMDRPSFGGNSLPGDPLGDAGGAKNFELDYDRGTEHAYKPSGPSGPSGKRRSRPRRTARRPPSASKGPLIVAGGLLLLLLLAPRFMLGGAQRIGRAVETNAVSASPDRLRSPTRREAPGKHPVALRDVLFDD